jgi:hypothetical protein
MIMEGPGNVLNRDGWAPGCAFMYGRRGRGKCGDGGAARQRATGKRLAQRFQQAVGRKARNGDCAKRIRS